MPGVVDEQVDPRVPLEHARGDGRDRRAVGDVALLVLVARPGAGRRESPTTCQPARRERAAQLGADAGRGSRDDGDAHRRRP